MGFYVTEKDMVEQSFNDYEDGSAIILKKNPWYRNKVLIMDEVD